MLDRYTLKVEYRPTGGSEYDKISHGAGRADSGLRGGIDLDAIQLCVRSESLSENEAREKKLSSQQN
jgi:hypothetical protein